MKKVGVVTGTRADYGIYYPVLQKIKSAGLPLYLYAARMHFAPEYGETYKEILNDGFEITAKIESLLAGDTGASMARSIGMEVLGFTQAFETHRPDVLLILGDRGEMLAAAIAAIHLDIPILHLHGGEVSKTVDDMVRYAISRLSHIHLVATEKSKERLLKTGEEEWRIKVVGAPRLDSILHVQLPDRNEIFLKLGIKPEKKTALAVYHPVTVGEWDAEKKMEEFLQAVTENLEQIVLIYPNADAGSKKMIKVIDKYKKHGLVTYKSLNHIDYLALLKNVDIMVGNSSSGIIEAPSFKIPVVNVGERQEGRERAENVIDCGETKEEIIAAINKALYDKDFKEKLKFVKNPYGDGKASKRIIDLILNLKIDDKLLAKRLTY